jgi:hypothetical protein
MELLISLLFKAAPYLIVALGALGVYFGVKRKGVREERERQEVRQVEAKKQAEAKVARAVNLDEAVDVKTAEKVKEIEAKNTIQPRTGFGNDDIFRF